LYEQTKNLRAGQIIALRFASDEELTELVRKTLSGELKSSKEIKLAVKKWRGDYLRV
jgi:predicted transcriptional regulator